MTDVQQPVLRVKKRLPSGRAVLGGLLVALAVVAVLVASQIGEDSTFQDVVVARQDLTPGTVIAPEHIQQVRIRLSSEADWVVHSPESILGSVVLGPVAQSEFIQVSNISEGSSESLPAGLAEVSIEIESSRAPARLASGELVSILATFSDNEGSRTTLIADRVVVLSYNSGEGTDFAGGDTVLRLGVADGDIASSIVTAAITGDVSVLGVTGANEVDIPRETLG